jgi:monoamine oxidase
VVIVGAGLAGLSAAHELKKQKIPFCLFEAHRNCGGRIASVKFVNKDGRLEIHEQGADFFDRQHFRVFQLAKDLGLRVEEQDEGLEWSLATDGRLLKDPKPLEAYFRKIARDRLNLFSSSSGDFLESTSAKLFDQMSAADYLRAEIQGSDPKLEIAFLRTIEQFWGAPASEISALQFLFQFDHESAHSPFSSAKRFRVVGGNQELIDRLLIRVDSLVPNFILRPQHELIALRSRSTMYELVFKTWGGEKSYYCKNLLIALPAAKLREVEGWASLGFQSDFLNYIRDVKMSHHVKTSLAYTQKFWAKKTINSEDFNRFEGQVFGDWPLHNLAEVAPRKSNTEFENKKKSVDASGSLLIQSGDRSAENLFSQILASPSRSLSKVWPESEKYFDRLVSTINWSRHPNIQGSKAIFGAHQFARRSEFWKKMRSSHTVQFAGEHVSHKWPGTMEGAIESALEAVRFFINLPKGRG